MPTQTMMLGLLRVLHVCAMMYESTADTLLHRPDAHMRRHQIKLLHDCASICELCAKYISRHSPVEKAICEFCAYVCEVCGHECLRHPDHESQICGHICLNCARECRAMAMTM
jgi:hypothetical protein